MFVVDDLQLEQADNDNAEQEYRDAGGENDACKKQPSFGVVVLNG